MMMKVFARRLSSSSLRLSTSIGGGVGGGGGGGGGVISGSGIGNGGKGGGGGATMMMEGAVRGRWHPSTLLLRVETARKAFGPNSLMIVPPVVDLCLYHHVMDNNSESKVQSLFEPVKKIQKDFPPQPFRTSDLFDHLSFMCEQDENDDGSDDESLDVVLASMNTRQRALSHPPNVVVSDAILSLAKSYEATGDAPRALRLALVGAKIRELALGRHDVSNSVPLFYIADLHSQLGNTTEALLTREEAIKISMGDPRHIDPRTVKGVWINHEHTAEDDEKLKEDAELAKRVRKNMARIYRTRQEEEDEARRWRRLNNKPGSTSPKPSST
jgi:hypothetical protein